MTLTLVPGNCPTCGLLCPLARGWGRCPEASFEVLTERMGEFAKRFEALVRRAVKLGCTPPSYTCVTEYTRIAWLCDSSGAIRQPRRSVGGDRITAIMVQGAPPRFEGWSLLATLTPIALPEGSVNLVKSVPGAGELPAKYRTSGAVCDHCDAVRGRKETFVVGREDGTTKQVGRQCIRDFLGGDSPEHVAAMFTFWTSVGEIGDEEGGGWGMGRRVDSYSLVAYLALVVREVRAQGWLSRKAASEQGKQSSADAAWQRICPSPLSGRRAELADEDEVTMATSAVAWACATTEESDYMHNVRAVALSGSVDPSTMGIGASIWTAYERAMNREVEMRQKRASVAASQWQGTIDASIGPLFLTVTRVLDLDSDFGVTHLHMMQDAAGNAYKWFASSTRLEDGKLYRVEGKVKKHDEYKGIKNTVLTRCDASDPTKAVVILSQAMQRLYPGLATGALRQVSSDLFEGDLATLTVARDHYMGVKGASATKAAQRLQAALATVIAVEGMKVSS